MQSDKRPSQIIEGEFTVNDEPPQSRPGEPLFGDPVNVIVFVLFVAIIACGRALFLMLIPH